jgi:hypothetical protein
MTHQSQPNRTAGLSIPIVDGNLPCYAMLRVGVGVISPVMMAGFPDTLYLIKRLVKKK